MKFSYIDLEDMSEHYVSVPEQGGGKLIPEGMCDHDSISGEPFDYGCADIYRSDGA